MVVSIGVLGGGVGNTDTLPQGRDDQLVQESFQQDFRVFSIGIPLFFQIADNGKNLVLCALVDMDRCMRCIERVKAVKSSCI